MEVGGAGGVFVDAAAIFGEDGEVDVEVLGAFFEESDFAFEGGFVHVGEFVFGVGGEVFGGLVLPEIAACLVSVDLRLDVYIEDLPHSLDAELAQLVVPILQSFLVLP